MFYKTVYSSKKISTFQVFSMNFIHKAEPSIIKSLFLVTIRFCHHLTNLSSYHLTAKHHFLTHPTFLIVPCNIYRSKIYCKWTSLFDRAYRANLGSEKVNTFERDILTELVLLCIRLVGTRKHLKISDSSHTHERPAT